MAAQSLPWLSFNRGLISRLALARIDIARGRLSASLMTNWMPRVLGSMMLRPGLGYIGALAGAPKFLPFIFSNSDTAIYELTASLLRIWVSDALITRPAVTSTITNGTFATDIIGWTDSDEAGATSSWLNTDTGAAGRPDGPFMGFVGDGTNYAIRDQTVTVAGANIGVEHAVRILVARGPVTVSIGTSTSDNSYFPDTDLQAGTHSIGFTPTGNFNIRFKSLLRREILVKSVAIEAAGTFSLSTPWSAASDLNAIRIDQSGDVIFIACDGFTQRRIERHNSRSWSIVQYLPEDGPFMLENVGPIKLATTLPYGNSSLSSSAPFFKSTHAPSTNSAGALFRIRSDGQLVQQLAMVGGNIFTDSIKITGVGTERDFNLLVTNTIPGVATLTLQNSLEGPDGPWTDITTRNANTTEVYNDTLNNEILWYRIGIKSGGYTSGTWSTTLSTTRGSTTGICRVTMYVNAFAVRVEVIKHFAFATASADWWEGNWSDRRGWPTAVAFDGGRLGWCGRDKIWLSVSDAFDVFDDETVGDSGPINRSIGSGPVDVVNWMLSLQRLVLGGQGAEWSARASSLDEPLTPTQFVLKPATSQGSAKVQAVKIDQRGVFVQKAGVRVFELDFGSDQSAQDYGALDLTQLVPDVGSPSIVRIAVQRQPDTRVHCVLSDGTVAVLVFDKTENTLCWCKVDTDRSTGFSADVKDVVVLPGTTEDSVYYGIQRTINSVTVHYLEKWALESEAVGGALNKQADAFVTYTGAAATVITGLSHLEGRAVTVWANGFDVGTNQSKGDGTWTHLYTVAGGQITLATAATNVVVGLPYKAQWKSGKLALQAGLGIPLTKKKRVVGLGLIVADTHAQGLFFGRDFTHMDPMPLIREGAPVSANSIISEAEDGSIPFPGEWKLDSRVCLEARSPRPCTLLAMVADAELHEQH